MSDKEAIELLQNAIAESERVIVELKQAKDKAERAGMVGEYYSNLENCEKEIEACRIAISALRERNEPVRHGRWIPLEYDGFADGNPVWDLWECSECGEEHSGDEDTLTPYCSNCGAKMDGGDQNE